MNDTTSQARQEIWLNRKPAAAQNGHHLTLFFLARQAVFVALSDVMPVPEDQREGIVYFMASRACQRTNPKMAEYFEGKYLEDVRSHLDTDSMREGSDGYSVVRSRYAPWRRPHTGFGVK